jgi:hypothetical protein
MDHPAPRHFIHIAPILRHTHFPQPLSVLYHDKDCAHLSQPHKGCRNKAILKPHALNPWCNSIPNSKTHRVTNEDDRDYSFARQRAVRVDAIRNTQLQPYRIRHSDYAHRKNGSKPVRVVRGPDAPKYQPKWDQQQRWHKQPQSVLRLHDAVISARFAHYECVAQPACVCGADCNSKQCRNVTDANDTSREAVGAVEDQRSGCVENVEPDEVGAVREASVEDHRKCEEGQGARHHALELIRFVEIGLLEQFQLIEVGLAMWMVRGSDGCIWRWLFLRIHFI